jgi:Zn-dependent protease with chaperone function
MGHDSFEAEVFGAAVPGGRLAGQARRIAGAVLFEGGGQRFELPLDGLAARVGGFDDRMLFVAHAAAPGVEIASLDPGFGDALSDLPGVGAALRQRRGGRSRFWGCAATSAALVAALLIGGFFGWKYLVAALSDQVSPELERKLGELSAEAAGLGEEQLAPEVDRLAASLTAASGGDGWRFFVVEDDTVNAFALPGGTIALHCGLVEQLEPEAVVGVLAHEIAHVELRHGLRSLVSTVALRGAIAVLLGDVSGFEGLLVAMGTDLAELGYSRELEQAADDRGAQLLEQAGIGSVALVAALEGLAAIETGATSLPAFLSSHPDPGVRAQRLARTAAVGTTPVDREAFEALRARCGS